MSAPFPEDVADYLKNNPGFFERYADLMAQIFVPHPHGGRAVSLAERQMLTLRDKNRETESKLAELIAFGEENDQISEKVHRLAVGLIAVETFSAVIHLLRFHLRDDFSVPHVALRLWKKPEGVVELPEFAAVAEELQVFADTLTHPYCGSTSGFGTGAWFGEQAARLRSQALVTLCDGGATIGMLALGSEDAKRFYPEMGTLYLERIGEMVSAALARVAKPAK
jgi:uncharacterized protein YigA (DUF484 family)